MSTPLSVSAEVGAATARPRLATGFWRRALRHRSFVTGGALRLMVLCAALLSLVWTPWSAYEIDVASKLRPPRLRTGSAPTCSVAISSRCSW